MFDGFFEHLKNTALFFSDFSIIRDATIVSSGNHKGSGTFTKFFFTCSPINNVDQQFFVSFRFEQLPFHLIKNEIEIFFSSLDY